MSEISFGEDEVTQPAVDRTPHLVRFVQKYSFGLLSNIQHANFFLLLLAGCCLAGSIFLIVTTLVEPQADMTDYPLGIVPEDAM